jgi:hypothetical protein
VSVTRRPQVACPPVKNAPALHVGPASFSPKHATPGRLQNRKIHEEAIATRNRTARSAREGNLGDRTERELQRFGSRAAVAKQRGSATAILLPGQQMMGDSERTKEATAGNKPRVRKTPAAPKSHTIT